jgi:hypothetical protein
VRVVAPADLERVDLELRASSSSRHSSPNVPSTKPGARNAFIGGVFSFAAYSTVRTLSHA